MDRAKIRAMLQAEMAGMELVNFRLLYGGTLVLYLGHDANSATKSEKTFWIDSAWRVCVAGSMLAGSLDDAELILPIFRNVQGKRLVSVTLTGPHGDLSICVEGDVVVESFVRDYGEEQWELRRADGVQFGLGT